MSQEIYFLADENNGARSEYTSQFLAYRDEIVFTDCNMREFWDVEHSLNVDRDINAGINIKRVGLELFPTLKRRKGKTVEIAKSTTHSTLKEVLAVLKNAPEAYTVFGTPNRCR